MIKQHLGFVDRLHMRHRFLSMRFKSERPSIRFVLEHGLEGRNVIDIGANKGVYSYYLSRAVGPQGRVIAFEAQPELGGHLNAVKNSFGLDNLIIVNQGLSSSPGVLTMTRDAIGSGGATFGDMVGDGHEKIEIPVTTLDDYFADKGTVEISFIKCDVEGHELEVFKGGRGLLERYHPTLLFECHEDQAQEGKLFSFLVDLGYDGFFYHVEPADHASLLRSGKGRYIHYSEFDRFEYTRPHVTHRNYIFVKQGLTPEARR